MDRNAQQPQQPVNPQPVQQQSQQAVPTSSRSSLPNMLFFALGIIVVLGLMGGSYYLGTKKSATIVSNEKTAVIPTKSIPTVTATPAPDVTANWKVYTNPTYHFSFKYPPSWLAADSHDDYGIRTDIVTVGANDRMGSLLSVYMLKNPNNLSTTDFIKQLPNYEGGGFVKPLQNQPSYFSHIDAIETNGFGGAGDTGPSAYINDKKGEIFKLFTSGLDNSMINTIFSTFTFNQ